jgi:hypothetical protein
MDHFFCEEWRNGNFLIPANKKYREELLAAMLEVHEGSVSKLPQYADMRKVLKARIAALMAYDQV